MRQPADAQESIYRTQALQFRKNAWLGTARLTNEASGRSTAIIAVATLIALAALLVFGEYSERVSAAGTVVFSPPVIVLFPPDEGIVVASFVIEGQRVAKGTPIFAVSTAPQIARGSFTHENRKLLDRRRAILQEEARQIRARIASAHALLKEKSRTNDRTEQHLAALAKRAKTHMGWLSAKLAKYEKLRKSGTALEPELIERMKDLFLAYESLATAELKALEIQREHVNVREQRLLVEKEEQALLHALSNQIFELDQRILDIDRAEAFLVRAPVDGTLASVTAQTGTRVVKTRNLAVLIPDGAIAKVEVFTPSDSIGKINNGQPAKLRVAAFPYRQYGKIAGAVESISATPVTLGASPSADAGNPSFYRITLTLTPAPARHGAMPLSAGMDVQAEIFLRTARLYEWIFKTAGNLLS